MWNLGIKKEHPFPQVLEIGQNGDVVESASYMYKVKYVC